MGRNGEKSPLWEEWRASPRGIYADRRKQRLLIEFLQPVEHERVLYIGPPKSTSINYLKKKGCALTLFVQRDTPLRGGGVEGGGRQVHAPGNPEDLPYSDDEFDVAVLETCLEFAGDPERVVSEAVRVCRGRVFIAVPNRFSLHGSPAASAGNASRNGRVGIRFFSPGEILRIIRSILPDTRVRWGSVLFFPYRWYPSWSDVEERIPMARNPFGFCLGFSFPVVLTLRTLQEPLTQRIMADLKPDTGFRSAGKMERGES